MAKPLYTLNGQKYRLEGKTPESLLQIMNDDTNVYSNYSNYFVVYYVQNNGSVNVVCAGTKNVVINCLKSLI